VRRYRLRWGDGRVVSGDLRELKPIWVYSGGGSTPRLETQSRPRSRWRPYRRGVRYGAFITSATGVVDLVEVTVPSDWADLYERRLSWLEFEVGMEVECDLWPIGPDGRLRDAVRSVAHPDMWAGRGAS